MNTYGWSTPRYQVRRMNEYMYEEPSYTVYLAMTPPASDMLNTVLAGGRGVPIIEMCEMALYMVPRAHALGISSGPLRSCVDPSL